MLRVAIGLGVAALGVGALVGSERAASRQTGSDRVVVTYWEKWTGDEMNAMKRVVDAFNASQDRIFVKYLSISGIADKTLLAASGGNPPDVAGLWSDQVVQFADAGALTDMSELAKEHGIGAEDYIPAYWNQVVYDGGLYALPTSPGSAAIHVNRALMPPEYDTPEEFPKTISEFDRFVDKVTRRNRDGSLETIAFLPRDGWGLWNLPHLFGGSFVEGEKVDVNGPDDLKAWTWVHSFAVRFGVRETQSFRSGFGNYSSPQNPFLSGKLATYSDGPWFSNFIRLYNPRLDWFAVPFPYPDGRPDLKGFTTLNLNTLMIPKGAAHPREAFEFLAFVQRQPVMERLCKDQRCNSPLAEVSEEFFRTHPNKEIRLFDRLARSPRAVGPIPMGIRNQIGSEVANAVDLMDLGQKKPKQALDDAQTRLEEIWAKYRRQVLAR
ncbi:MAG TPA: extracellular solute-binding protein [Fimbriimonas sp.]